jgi:hypothetical protein
MGTLSRRNKWTIAVAFMFIICEVSLFRVANMKALFAGGFLCASAAAYTYIRLGMRYFTSERATASSEWSKRTARRISFIAFGIVVAWIPFFLYCDGKIGSGFDDLQLNLTSVSMGLMFGAMLGCGGVLGIPDDDG